MSEFSFPPNTTNNKKTNFFSLLLSDFFFHFCSFIISHPLYFSYFIFFSPYIIKILSFLSPLFITTSLLLLSLFTTFVNNNTSCTDHFEDLEAYKIVFDTSCSSIANQEDDVLEEEWLSTSEEAPIDKHVIKGCLGARDFPNSGLWESSQLIAEVKSLGGFLKEDAEEEESGDGFVYVSCKKGDKEGKPLRVDETFNSQSLGVDDDDDRLWSNESDVGLYKTGSFGSSLGSFGSMRKEKEWRRTLACKLFEERHNNNNNDAEGSEGMDMLWETYEADSNKQQQKQKQKQKQLLVKSKTKKGKKWSEYEHHDEETDDDDDDDDDGKLCCLQALKFSAGKMNLGMGRPNLVKISKAFKGIGWLHGMTKHGKKIYH